MSALPSDGYITATKLIESFSCFFEKINNASSLDAVLNAQNLAQLKKIIYSNISSPENILSASKELLGKEQEEYEEEEEQRSQEEQAIQSPVKSHALYSARLLDQSQQIEPDNDYCVPRNFFSVQPSQISHQAEQEEILEEKPKLNTEYLPATSFLALIKAACHNDMSKLFSLSASYAYIRTFTGQSQAVFTALCFSFLERIVKEKGGDSQFDMNQSYHQKSREDSEFLNFFKTFCQNSSEVDMTRKFYDAITANSRFYQSALSLFKEHIVRVVLDREARAESFEWLNDLDEAEDASFAQQLTKVFNCNLKFLILTRVRLIEKIFHHENEYQPNPTLTIFFDKTSKTSFILYPHDRVTEEESENNYQRAKIKPTVNTHFMKPSFSNDSQKSLKNIGMENHHGSLTTLDTINTPITSLNEIEHKEKPKNVPATRPAHLKKANTLNIFTTSLNDCSSPSFTYPESALIRPSVEKINYPGFSSASKDLGYYRMKTEEDSLVRKDREPAPPRPFYGESPMSEERTFGKVSEKLDFSRQMLEVLPEEPRMSNMYLERNSPKRESICLRKYMSETRSQTEELFHRAASIDIPSLRGNQLRSSGNENMPSIFKPIALPILLKSKLDRFNHTINQHDQELANTVVRHVQHNNGVGEAKEKGTELISIMSTYQAIMGHSQETRERPSIVRMLRMDR